MPKVTTVALPGDSNNDLLMKLVQLFRGTAPTMGSTNELLKLLVNSANAVTADSLTTLTYAASVEVDFQVSTLQTLTLAGNVTFTSASLAAPYGTAVRVIADGSLRTLTFPAGWVFVGTKPADIAANKTGILSVTAFGAADTDVVAVWAVEE